MFSAVESELLSSDNQSWEIIKSCCCVRVHAMVCGRDMHEEMSCAKSSVLSWAERVRADVGRGCGCAVRSARMPGGRKAVRTRRKKTGGRGRGGGGALTRYLGLDAGLVGAEQLSLDGLHHTLETSTGTWRDNVCYFMYLYWNSVVKILHSILH